MTNPENFPNGVQANEVDFNNLNESERNELDLQRVSAAIADLEQIGEADPDYASKMLELASKQQDLLEEKQQLAEGSVEREVA